MSVHPCCGCCLADTPHPYGHEIPCTKCNHLKGAQPMTTISYKDRAEAQAMAETFAGCPLSPLGVKGISRWLDVRDRAFASHTCQPVWRPTTAAEIQPGWEIRSRYKSGHESTWGTAHYRDGDRSWRTKSNVLLTHDTGGWTYETTAPLPEPEPDPRVAVVLEWADDQGDDINAESLLARLDSLKGE